MRDAPVGNAGHFLQPAGGHAEMQMSCDDEVRTVAQSFQEDASGERKRSQSNWPTTRAVKSEVEPGVSRRPSITLGKNPDAFAAEHSCQSLEQVTGKGLDTALDRRQFRHPDMDLFDFRFASHRVFG